MLSRIPRRSLIHICQDDAIPNHPDIRLFSQLLLRTRLHYHSLSSLVYRLPSSSSFIFSLSPFFSPPLQKQFSCQFGLLVDLMFFSGVPVEAVVISVVRRYLLHVALIAGAGYSSVNERRWAGLILPEVQFTSPDALPRNRRWAVNRRYSLAINSVQLCMMGCARTVWRALIYFDATGVGLWLDGE